MLRWRSPEATSADYDRFKRLRTLIVKELHPDNAPKDSADWAARTELFKVIWPKVDETSDELDPRFPLLPGAANAG